MTYGNGTIVYGYDRKPLLVLIHFLSNLTTLKKIIEVADPIELFFFVNEEFLHFLLLSWVILLLIIFSICNKTLKLNSENWKTKKKVLQDRPKARKLKIFNCEDRNQRMSSCQ